jgi:hypothetical protein
VSKCWRTCTRCTCFVFAATLGWHATPSVKLLIKIPQSVDAVLPQLWCIGEVFVHIKDQVLQPSSCDMLQNYLRP